MKTNRSRGMRDVTTLQGLRSRSVPSSREQIMAELSRLEHEKARLERERGIWLENQRNTEERLSANEERIALLQAAFEQMSGGRSARPARAQRPAAGRPADDEPPTEWSTFVLEY